MPLRVGLAPRAGAHYLRVMPLPRPSPPRVLIEDLRNFWRGRPRSHWIAALLAGTMTTAIVLGFYIDSQSIPDTRQEVMFINSWPASRTDAEIRASQQAGENERRRAEAEHRRQLQRLDQNLNRLGI
jgi:hypothetical protein